jgi:hypothetical protein
MSEFQKIEVIGPKKGGSQHFIISGPGTPTRAGVTLNPGITNGIDAPVQSLWVPGAYGQKFVDFRWQRRDMVFSVQTFVQSTGDDRSDAETWLTIDSNWRYAFDYVDETIIRYTTSAGVRELKVRMLEAPKAYETNEWEKRDPFIHRESTVVMTVSAELPFFQGDDLVYDFEMPGTMTRGRGKINIDVDCDVPVWGRWTLTDQATWTLPDFSWGDKTYGRSMQDEGRMVPLPPLRINEGLVADSDPRVQTLIASNRAPVQSRWKGQDLLYPYAPGASGKIPIAVKDVPNGYGAKARLRIPRWYTRPWSRPLP